MSQSRDPNAKAPPPAEPAEAVPEDNSLAAASEDTIREIEKRREAGGYDGFGDIG